MKLFTFLLALTIIFSACSSDNDETLASEAKAITEFTINSVSAKIDEETKSIQLTLPIGTDVTKLIPKVKVSDKASVTPESDVVVDFTSTVTYTVTAENGTKTVYMVTVDVAKASDAKITAFTFAALEPKVEGIVDETNKTIILTVPNGTDVKALVPSIASVGLSVSPASEVAQDFSKNVKYTVIAEDGTKVDYTITVVIEAPEFKPEITQVTPKSPLVGTDITIEGVFLNTGNKAQLKDFAGEKVIDLVVKEQSSTKIIATIPQDASIVEGEYIVYVICNDVTVHSDNLNRVALSYDTSPRIVSIKNAKIIQGKDEISLTTVNVPNVYEAIAFKKEGASQPYYTTSFNVSNNGTAVKVSYTNNLEVGKQVLYLILDGKPTNEIALEVVENTNKVPTITSVTPNTITRDDEVTVYGTNLGDIFNTTGLVYYEINGEYKLLSDGTQLTEWGEGFVKFRPGFIPKSGTGKFKVQVRVDGQLSNLSEELTQK